MDATIIGVDYATDPDKVGLVRATYASGRLRIDSAKNGHDGPANIVARWVDKCTTPLLIAVDAPLGWPAPLAEALSRHSAGDALRLDANTLFQRNTDRVLHAELGKKPLDVGADRIARTAHAALNFLDKIRCLTQRPIPLAWQPNFDGCVAIEVYPAGTLVSHGLDAKGYKGKSDRGPRERILSGLSRIDGLEIDIPGNCKDDLLGNDNILDALLCAVAGTDFLENRTICPRDLELAKREGWIWVARRGPGQ